MKIIFFEVLKGEREYFEKALPGFEVVCYEEKLNKENLELAKDAEILSVFINSTVNKELIDSMPNLKFITTRSTGYEHIDKDYCKEKGIVASNVPAYGSYTVAEFTIGLLMNLSRKILYAHHRLRTGTDYSVEGLGGFDLMGKTIGIIGTGKIGKNVAKIAKGLSMKVIAFDLYPDQAFATEHGLEYKNLDDVIKESDVITLHVPYTKENHHIINKERIATMKKGVYIINTARGDLMDTSALIWGLNEGIVAGAGLDVLEGEKDLKEEMEILAASGGEAKAKDYKTLFADHVLIDMPNVIVTPHIAFYSKEAEEEIIKTTVDNINSFNSGNPVNLLK